MTGFSYTRYASVLVDLYLLCARKALVAVYRNWCMLIGSVLSFLIFAVTASFLVQLGLVGGFIAGLLHIALLTLYFGWMRALVRRERLRWQDLLEFDTPLFFGIISIAFILFILELLLSTLVHGLEANYILLLVNLVIFLAFNPVPEAIYLQNEQSIDGFRVAFDFTKDNWIEWFIPLSLLMTPWLLVSWQDALVSLSGEDVLFPALLLLQSAMNAGTWLFGSSIGLWPLVALAIIVANWFMVFRGHLFEELNKGSRRQRLFRARQA